MTSSSINNRIDHEMSLSELDQVAGGGLASSIASAAVVATCPAVVAGATGAAVAYAVWWGAWTAWG